MKEEIIWTHHIPQKADQDLKLSSVVLFAVSNTRIFVKIAERLKDTIFCPCVLDEKRGNKMKCVILLAVLVAFVAVTQARPQSDCEKHRENAEKIGTIMKLIPKCKENGDYEELQCYRDSKFCVCYDKKGHPASPISSKIKECGCHLRRKEKLDRREYTFPKTHDTEPCDQWRLVH
ncbi:U24-ctenitoxin-Pn1a [Araneus ventricosus]|uniref:U24-ctenitoxin-Pn1a n=1 Tax=Araneus ventricosus TaxID=182803 RepID=A0A4Y2FIQ0_ARAVE|nr:U24-ctenitoxin-Pn1a [Araneus ventricosus]